MIQPPMPHETFRYGPGHAQQADGTFAADCIDMWCDARRKWEDWCNPSKRCTGSQGELEAICGLSPSEGSHSGHMVVFH